MVEKSGAFTAGQMQTAINAGLNAEMRLAKHDYQGSEERAELEHYVRMGRDFKALLEEHKKRYHL